MTAPQRRRAVREAMTAAQLWGRRACRFTACARSTHRYPRTRDDTALRARLETLAIRKPRWGYRRLHWLLGREGERVNRKRVQRGWVLANERQTAAHAAKGYHYQLVFAWSAVHVDRTMRQQTLPEALEWLWKN